MATVKTKPKEPEMTEHRIALASGVPLMPLLAVPTSQPDAPTARAPESSAAPTELHSLLKNNERVLGVSLRCNYGAIEIEFEIREIANPQTVAEQDAELDKLTAQLEHAHDMFADNRLGKFRDRGSVNNGKPAQKQEFKPASKPN